MGYYIKSEDGSLLTEHNGNSNNILLHCTGEEEAVSCEVDTSTIGYVVNAKDKSKYILCKAKSNGKNNCDIYDTEEIPNEGKSCSVGNLYYYEGNYKLCIDKNNLVSVNTDNESSYLVDAMTKSAFIHEDIGGKSILYRLSSNIGSQTITYF